MSEWTVVYTNQAERDWAKIRRSNLRERALSLIALLQEDPFRFPPAFEVLVGELAGAYSRRLNVQHRLVYEVSVELRMVKILSMSAHYE